MTAIIIATVGVAAAFVLGYCIGKSAGYTAGAVSILEQQIHEEEDVKEKKEIHPDCGWM